MGDSARFSQAETWHMAKVCRVKPGDTVSATDGKGAVYRVEMTSISKSNASGTIVSVNHKDRPQIRCDLALPFVVAQKADTVVEKCTEVGVSGFRLFACENSVTRRLSEKRIERLERVAVSAIKQSMRAFLPKITIHADLTDLTKPFDDYDHVLYGHLADESKNPREVVGTIKAAGSILVLVGPEPGFSDAEIELLDKTDAVPVRYGDHRLRTETAAIVLPALVIDMWTS